MPHSDASGKTSYPYDTKVEMFKHAYESFAPWHSNTSNDVFFYLCMEDPKIWNDTFGYEYFTNNDFEKAMLSAYCNKLGMEFLV